MLKHKLIVLKLPCNVQYTGIHINEKCLCEIFQVASLTNTLSMPHLSLSTQLTLTASVSWYKNQAHLCLNYLWIILFDVN